MKEFDNEEEIIEILNDGGMLSSAFLQRKFKYTLEHARVILRLILKYYENIIALDADRIYIDGRFELPPRKGPKKYKDVTKP